MPKKKNPHAPYWVAIDKRKREVIEGALEVTGGQVMRAASILGIDRTYLTKLMKELEIDPKRYSAAGPKT